ncbi:MAG: ATP-binding cassette domain-containing protein [Hyphomicrobiaceae bacterium]
MRGDGVGERRGLSLDEVRIGLGGRALLAISADVGRGEVLTVMGPSGSGKSTLLAFVAGFLPDAFRGEGRIRIDGRDVTGLPPHERRIGLMFQDALLFPHLSVGGNLLFGMPARAPDRRRIAEEALASAGLPGFADRDPATLSGGQQQRVALLRVLLSEPRALLLDEPFNRLDRDLKAELRRFVLDRVRAAGLPTLMVTHDEADAEAAGGPVIRL